MSATIGGCERMGGILKPSSPIASELLGVRQG